MENAAAGISLVVPREYPLILLSCVILCIECVVFAMAFVAPARMKYFNKEFMAQFKEEH